MSFIIYDLILLAVFVIFISSFLYIRRKNLKKEGLLLLYKTSWGMKLIDCIGEKYKRTLKVLSYVSIGIGYMLMASMIYLFYTIVKIYVSRPDIVRAVKVPPIMPLVPYIDKLVPGLPSFNFTYWIIIIAIIAVTHEFSHGIFMRRYKVKIKSTGFGFFPFFLPVFLAAFVEQDEKSFNKASKFEQMAILSAGTFANVLTAILFFVVLWAFFVNMFVPAGVVFDTYAYEPIMIAGISMVNNISLVNPSYEQFANLLDNDSVNYIVAQGKGYYGVKGFYSDTQDYVSLYDDAPAVRANLSGAITAVNGVGTNSEAKLGEEILKYSPGEKITLSIYNGEDIFNRDIVLGQSPDDQSKAWLGIAFITQEGTGIRGKIITWLSSFKDPHTYYTPKYDGISIFIYDLLWWIVLISISVALINMLPVGIFDGGRFFYLTIWVLTKNETFAKKSFAFVTWLFLFFLFLIMAFWILRII